MFIGNMYSFLCNLKGSTHLPFHPVVLKNSTCFLLNVLLRLIETFFFHLIEKVNIFLKHSCLYFLCIPCFVILETTVLVIY